MYAAEGSFATATMYGFIIDAASGALTAVPGSPFTLPSSFYNYGVAAEGSGKYVYAVDANSGLVAYAINSVTGGLTLVNGPVGPGALGIAVASLPASTATLVSLQITPTNPTITSSAVGLAQQFIVVGTYSDASRRFLTGSVTWASSNPGVATISNQPGTNGLATTTGFGTTFITADFGGVTASTMFTVTGSPLQSLVTSPANPTIAVGHAVQLTATGHFADGSTGDLTSSVAWTSNNLPRVLVSSSGLAQAVGTGSATVSGTLNGVTGSTTVTGQ